MRQFAAAVFTVAALLSAAPAAAQAPGIHAGAVSDWSSQAAMLMKLAAAMPADKFGFRPTPAQRTFGEQLLHIAQANIVQLGRLGAAVKAPDYDMQLTDPRQILATLERSFDYGLAVLKTQSDQSLLEPAQPTRFDGGMGPSARIRIVYYDIGHTWDIYGQLVVYLRLNGITPPASQRI